MWLHTIVRAALGLLGMLVLFSSTTAWAQPRDRFADLRRKMVDDYVVREGVKNPRVLEAMRSVPRHLFVPTESQSQAYFDQALSIGHKQTISPPFIVAYMTESLDPQPSDKVLEIGTGSGYQAAVLSPIVKEVYSIEIVEPLGTSAAKRLKDLKYDNVKTFVGDGYKGWPEYAPFDKIIVTCSPEKVPEPLIEQLKEGGRMIVPLGERYEQVFYLFEKKNGQLERKRLQPTLFVPMTGISEANREVKPDPAKPELRNGGFELDADANGQPDNWHYQRQLRVETTGAPEGKVYITLENKDPGRPAQLLQGMALDGSQVEQIELTLSVKGTALKNGQKPYEKAYAVLQYYDADRKPCGQDVAGPWVGTFGWKNVAQTFRVPKGAKEAIMHIGLNGATGSLSLDNVRLNRVSR